MARKKSKSNDLWGDMGNMEIPTFDDYHGKSNNSIGFGFDAGNMGNVGIPTLESNGSIDGGLSDIGIPSFKPLPDDAPTTSYRQNKQTPDIEQPAMFDMFGFGKKPQPQQEIAEVQVFEHRGKKMVQDPENPRLLIPLTTYKRRYGNSTTPQRQTRNNIGKNLNEVRGSINQARDYTQKATSFIKDKTANRKYQPDGKKMKVQRDVAPVKYVVLVTFDDGSQTEIIRNSLVEAQTEQRRMQSDPHVKHAELTYI